MLKYNLLHDKIDKCVALVAVITSRCNHWRKKLCQWINPKCNLFDVIA